MFARGSRYENIENAELNGPDGRTIRYKRMRFPDPPPASLSLIVGPEDRPDHLAHRAFGDSEQFWRLADAEGVTEPDQLAIPGRRIAVPGPVA